MHKTAILICLAWALAMAAFTVAVTRSAVANFHVLNTDGSK